MHCPSRNPAQLGGSISCGTLAVDVTEATGVKGISAGIWMC